jgi:hypothetical protein
VAIAGTAVAGLQPLLAKRAARHVAIHAAAEMPNLDTGVRQPVHVTFIGDRLPGVGQVANLKFVVTSGATGADIQARIVTPGGAVVSTGLSNWEGHLEYQQAAEIPVGVTFAGDKGGFVRGEVITRLPDGQTFKNATAVYVDPGRPDTTPPEARTLTEPDGSKLDVVVWKNQ